jgi:hypothetical protein
MKIPIRDGASGANAGSDEHQGPPLLGLAIVVTGLLVGSLVTTALMTHGGHLPSPFEPARATAAFFAEQAAAVRLSAFLQFGLTLAALSELATFTLIVREVAYLLPIAHFGTLIWMIAVGVSLPQSLGAAESARRAHQPESFVARAHPS